MCLAWIWRAWLNIYEFLYCMLRAKQPVCAPAERLRRKVRVWKNWAALFRRALERVDHDTYIYRLLRS